MNEDERRARTAKIAPAREMMGLTQIELAKAARVSRRTVQGWEREGRASQEAALRRAEIVLGITRPPLDLNAVEGDIYAVLVALAAFMQAVDLDTRRTITEAMVSALRPPAVVELGEQEVGLEDSEPRDKPVRGRPRGAKQTGPAGSVVPPKGPGPSADEPTQS